MSVNIFLEVRFDNICLLLIFISRTHSKIFKTITYDPRTFYCVSVVKNIISNNHLENGDPALIFLEVTIDNICLLPKNSLENFEKLIA